MGNKNKPEIVILETARLNKNMSKGEFAEYLGVHSATLSKILNGKIEIGDEVARKIKSKGINIDKPIIKEKEVGYGGLSLIKQIKLLEERNQAINIEFEKVKAQIIQLKKDCGRKEDCLVKNIKIENET